jgi:hypothetical protein
MVCALIIMPVSVFAQEMLSANDFDPVPNLTADLVEGIFTLKATAAKPMKIEVMDSEMIAEDGEIFNARISTGGAGDATTRSVVFTTEGATTVTVYTLNSSKTDNRILVLKDAGGKTISEQVSPPAASGAQAKVVTFNVPAAGSYFLTSKSSGIYIYAVIVE